MRNKNYEAKASEKGKTTAETSIPLTIEKPTDIMPKILKGVFKKSFHNPNSRVASNYSIVYYWLKFLVQCRHWKCYRVVLLSGMPS